MSDEQPASKPAGRIARDAAIEQAVGTLAYIAVAVAVSMAITKRDAVMRAFMWVRSRLRDRDRAARKARESLLLAGLRRDMARMEHGDGPAAGPRGLYEG